MKEVKKFLLPVGIFLIGMGVILGFLVFMPTINTTVQTASAMIGPEKTSAFWGLRNLMAATGVLVFAGGLLTVVIAVLVGWAKRR